jgi:hypothetical protein
MSASSRFASIHRPLPNGPCTGAPAASPFEEAIRKAGQQRSHPLLVSKHAMGLCSCVLALRATQMGHCFMAVDAIDF